MFIYGKTSANAIAVMSFLAGHPDHRAGSGEIAEARMIPRTLAAKLLTQLAGAGLVHGQPGPGGGYTLAKEAKEISFLHIVSLFEQTDSPPLCPFGHHWCGNYDPCPLHDTLMEMQEANQRFLEDTRLSVFAPDYVGARPPAN